MFPLVEELRNVLNQLVKTLRAVERLCEVAQTKILEGFETTITTK